MQMSASVGGEFALQSRLEKTEAFSATGHNPANATTEGNVAAFCLSEPDFASG
jgi:hypothetical protein